MPEKNSEKLEKNVRMNKGVLRRKCVQRSYAPRLIVYHMEVFKYTGESESEDLSYKHHFSSAPTACPKMPEASHL